MKTEHHLILSTSATQSGDQTLNNTIREFRRQKRAGRVGDIFTGAPRWLRFRSWFGVLVLALSLSLAGGVENGVAAERTGAPRVPGRPRTPLAVIVANPAIAQVLPHMKYGVTTLTWEAGARPKVEVWLQINDGSETLFATGGTGQRQLQIPRGNVYRYTLISAGRRLGTATVVAAP